MWCVSEKSSLFLKDPTDLMTNVYGDTVVTTNGKHVHTQTHKTPTQTEQKQNPLVAFYTIIFITESHFLLDKVTTLL